MFAWVGPVRWLVDGIVRMEDVIKGYYQRQGVGDLYDEQMPNK